MNARQFREMYGRSLIGNYVHTQAAGAYPGGLARVIEIDPDPKAPEIVLTVRHPRWADDEGDNRMGVFEWEDIHLATSYYRKA